MTGRVPHRLAALVLLALGLAGCSWLPASDQEELGRGWEPPEVVGGDAREGRRLVAAIECGVCHSIPGMAGAHGVVGPPLEGFARRSLIAGRAPNRPPILVGFLQNAPELVPEGGMPRLPLDDAQARHIAAYLYTLR